MIDDETKEAQLKRQMAEQNRINLYHRVFGSKDGQELLADLKLAFDFDGPVFARVDRGDHTSFDTLPASLKDGARGVIIHINKMLAKPLIADSDVQPKKPAKKGLRK